MKNQNLSRLRALMSRYSLDAVIIPGSDPHASEYIAKHWQERRFISGFTGSAGTVAITTGSAALWTDSRYYLQGEEQLAGTGITLMRDGMPDTPTLQAWLTQELTSGQTVSIDATMFTTQTVINLQNTLQANGIKLDTTHDLVGEIWQDRPELPSSPILTLEATTTGLTAAAKITQLREALAKQHTDVMLFSTLDDIAWLLNIRGRDIEYNPVVISYLTISASAATLYIDSRKLDATAQAHLAEAGVTTKDYLQIFEDAKQLHGTIGIDFNKVNYALYQSINPECSIENSVSPIVLMKSIKNPTELKGIRQAMIKDGVALTNFFCKLHQQVASGKESELSAMEMLYQCRAEQTDFFSESFGTIAGYQEHGAIVHYGANAETNSTLHPQGLFLVDSGGQYLCGTTDITRTVALGPVTHEQQRDYTLVLKGHIALANARFPYGTRGTQLDVLARQFLWQEGLQYGHGTGHGIGHFLCVHEGPQSIRMDENPTKLEPGMVLSNEPGLYRAGKHGIRIENLIAVTETEDTPFGRFLAFDNLTLFPYDRNAMALEMLTNAEIEWIDRYHQLVYDLLSPLLQPEQKQWLDIQTKPLL